MGLSDIEYILNHTRITILQSYNPEILLQSSSRLFQLIALALLAWLTSTDTALTDLIFEHGIVGRTGASKFLTCEDLADVDQEEGDGDDAEYDEEGIEKICHV